MHKILTLLVCLAFSAMGAPADTSVQWGAVVDGLQMSIALQEGSDPTIPSITITIRNVGQRDVALRLGQEIAEFQSPEQLRLGAVDARGKSYDFEFVDVRYAGIAGGVRPLMIPLRNHASYSLTVRLKDFWLADMTANATLLHGTVRVTGYFASTPFKEMQPWEVKALQSWEGALQSNTLELTR